jgi:hypothetical protein
MTLTRTQRRNLAKLADYLEGLPKNYRHFDMFDYIDGRSDADVARYARNNGGVASCGTVACALGHGPAAGVLFRPSDFYGRTPSWSLYTSRFIEEYSPAWEWAFDSGWKHHDNHHWGAAARIRYLLKHGGPPDGFGCRAARKWRAHYREFDKRYAVAESDAPTTSSNPTNKDMDR